VHDVALVEDHVKVDIALYPIDVGFAVKVTVEILLLAVQLAVVPPLVPTQLHVHGPVPDIADPVPAVQRLVVGVVLKDAALEEPQAPFTIEGRVVGAM